MGNYASSALPRAFPSFPVHPLPPGLPYNPTGRPSTIPVDPCLPAPPQPGPIAIPGFKVSAAIHGLVRDLALDVEPTAIVTAFATDPDYTPDDHASSSSSSSSSSSDDMSTKDPDLLIKNEPCSPLALPPDPADLFDPAASPCDPFPSPPSLVVYSVHDTAFTRNLLHHALLGFTFRAALYAPRALLHAAHPHAQRRESCDTPLQKVLGLQGVASAARFERALLAANFHALSKLLEGRAAWTFALALEASPYFGLGGLEARVCMCAQGRLVSFHVGSISDPAADLPKLRRTLLALCPEARLKCAGVVTALSEEEHGGVLGAMVSLSLVYLMRYAPPEPRFFTPDMAEARARPPLLPKELGLATERKVARLVKRHMSRLELSWTSEEVDRITEEHGALKAELQRGLEGANEEDFVQVEEGDGTQSGQVDPHTSELFDEAWASIGERYATLRDFCGGLAASYLYTPKKRARVNMTGVRNEGFGRESAIAAANIILHAQQFGELRRVLVS